MPTYEYICNACGNEFEKFASMSAPPEKTCPKCGKKKVDRKISVGGGIIFKGGGFYETDYRGDAYKKAAEADKPSETKTESASESKPTESKVAETAAKTEIKAAESKPAETKSVTKPAAAPAATSESKASKSAAKPKR